MTPEELVKDGQAILNAFMSQLEGENDIYKQIVIEETIKFIYKEYYGLDVD